MVKFLGWCVIAVGIFLAVRHFSPETAGNVKEIGGAVLAGVQVVLSFVQGVVGYVRGMV